MHGKRKRREDRRTGEKLSSEDLLFLLSILEGELQARDEVIAVLKSEQTESHLLDVHYGFGGQDPVLRALQRDSLWAQQDQLQDVYRKPIAEFNHFIEAQRHYSGQMMKQLQEMSRSHTEALHRQREQEKSHAAFICRTNRLTSLLQQDRERIPLDVKERRIYSEWSRGKGV